MDDRQIEQMLRESCSPQMPEGMRERVLRDSFDELRRRPSNRWALTARYWKPILVCAAVLFVILANISDIMVQDRLARDIGKTPAIFASDFGFAKAGDTDSYLARPDIVQEAIRQHQRGARAQIARHDRRTTGSSPYAHVPTMHR